MQHFDPRALRALVALGALVVAPGATAQDARALNLKSLAATCAACHGTDGKAHPEGATTPLAGLPRANLAGALREFRDGKRSATVMHQLAKGYTDEQIDAIAAYFAAQPK
jgi:sulfide dehydrogenase cytochrome subunit